MLDKDCHGKLLCNAYRISKKKIHEGHCDKYVKGSKVSSYK